MHIVCCRCQNGKTIPLFVFGLYTTQDPPFDKNNDNRDFAMQKDYSDSPEPLNMLISESKSATISDQATLRAAIPIHASVRPVSRANSAPPPSPSQSATYESINDTSPASSHTSKAASTPSLEINPPKLYGKYRKPVKYTVALGNKDKIGSRAYYRSWEFRKKKKARLEKEAAELGPLLGIKKSGKVQKGGLTDIEGSRKVDERWRRYISRL